MRLSLTAFLTLAVLLRAPLARAQAPGNTVDLSLDVAQTSQIYVTDLDMQHLQGGGVLFTAILRSLSSTTIQVRLQLTVNVLLANGNSYPDIADLTTDPITLVPGQVRTITNIDLSGSNPSVGIEDSHYNGSQVDQLKDVAMATGKAPAGRYEFVVQCIDVNGSPASQQQTGVIVVSNPSRLDLALPLDNGSVSTPYPHFQWLSNVDTVILSVYQQEPSQQSAEDVVSGVPFLRTTLPNSTSPAPGSFNYPPSGPGVRPLQNGRTYYWYVEIPPSAERGSGIRSDIWNFTVGNADSSAFGAGASGNINDAATAALKKFLSESNYRNLASQIQMLTGQATYDGTTIGTEELIDILNNLKTSTVTSVTIH